VATALHDASVEFEIVPGVPTLNAAATYGGIPLLSSTMSSATVFVDGRLRTDPAQRPNWKAIAETGATVVIRNGLTMMRDIAADFIAAGVSADIPAAVVSHPGRVSQRVIVATLGTLSDVVFEARLMTNPTVIIGWPVLLRDELNWYDARPLTGRRVVLARGRYGNTAVAGRLEDIGAFVVEVPQPGIARLDLAELRGAIEGIAGYEWIVFATPAAVDIFWAEMILSGRDTRALANARIACLDPATAAALLDRGITVDVTQDRFAATPLIDILSERSDIPGAALLYVAGDGVAASFARDLENAGASVTALSIYREVPLARPLTRFRRTLHARPIDLAVVMSPGAATDYVLASGEAGLDEIPAAAYDAATADVLRESGVDVAVVPDRPGLELFIEAIRSKVPAIFEK
jgi:uroporphyrinogen III methyltransferase/synthase